MTREEMEFPNTWEEYEEQYGFNDSEEVYTNGARLIPSFRVKQWLDHLEQEPCEDAISRQEAIDAVIDLCKHYTPTKSVTHPHIDFVIEALQDLPPVNPQPKTGYISIDDVMSVFDDFMCGKADEDETDTFIEMLKDRAESEVNNGTKH